MKQRLIVLGAMVGVCLAVLAIDARASGFSEPRPYLRDGKWVYLVYEWGKEEHELRPLSPTRYDWAEAFHDGADSAVVANAGRFGLIDRGGKLLLPMEYDYVWPYRNDMAVVYRGGKYGAVDRSGKLVVPLEYDDLSGFSAAGRSAAVKGNRWGAIDRGNRELLPFIYTVVGANSDDGTMRAFDGKWTVFDRSGKPFAGERHADVSEYTDVLVAKRDGQEWLVDWNDRPVIDGGYDDVTYWPKHRIALVVRDGKAGAFDVAARRWILQPVHADIQMEHNGLLLVTSVGNPAKVHFSDRAGKKVGNADYEDGSIGFKSGYDFAWMKRDGAWGLINAQGRQIVPFIAKDHELIQVSERWIEAQSRNGWGWGLVDHQGKTLLPFEYDNDGNTRNSPFQLGLSTQKFVVVRHRPTDRQGVLDQKLQWVLPLGSYEDYGVIDNFEELVPVVRNGRYGLYHLGRRAEVVPTAYAWMGIENGFTNTVVDRDAPAYAGEANVDRWDVIVHGSWKRHEAKDYKLDRYDEESKRLVAYQGKNCGLFPGFEAGTRVGLADEDGRMAVPLQYDYLAQAWSLNPQWYYAEKGGKAGYIDADGRTVLPFTFDAWPTPCAERGASFYNGHIELYQQGQRVLVDAKGRVVARASEFGFPRTPSLSYHQMGNRGLLVGLMRAEGQGRDRDDQYRFLLDGERYEAYGNADASSSLSRLALNEGRLLVRKDGKYGYLDEEGRVVVPFEWDEAHPFSGGMAYAKHKGHWHIINRDGTIMKHVDVRLAFLQNG